MTALLARKNQVRGGEVRLVAEQHQFGALSDNHYQYNHRHTQGAEDSPSYGELAVCAGSCGLGNLHLINGLFDCHRSRNALCEAAIAQQRLEAVARREFGQAGTKPTNSFKNAG